MKHQTDSRLERIWLVAFADARLVKPRDRLLRQALQFGFKADHICLKNEHDLSPDWLARMKMHLVPGTRGFGYMCWKPQVCIEAMDRIPDGDILFYLDVGSHLNLKGKSRFYDYLNIVEKRNFFGVQARSFLGTEVPDDRHHVYKTSAFTKGDLLDYFGVRENEEIINAAQLNSGFFMLKKCRETRDFLSQWQHVVDDDFSLIDETPSKSSNMPDFVGHRHDQAIFSILWLLKRYPTVSTCEIEPLRKYAPAPKEFRHDKHWGPAWFWQMSRFPILAKRDKGLVSFWVKLYRFIRHRVLKRIMGY